VDLDLLILSTLPMGYEIGWSLDWVWAGRIKKSYQIIIPTFLVVTGFCKKQLSV
jgi:hypothetical protein